MESIIETITIAKIIPSIVSRLCDINTYYNLLK